MAQATIYKMVTERIMEMLKQDLVPWRMPWNSYQSMNWKTGKPYRGINQFILPPGEYATYKQVTEAGGRVVKKGAFPVVFWKPMVRKDEETGEEDRYFILRYYRVFNIETQCEGLESRREHKEYDHDPIEEAEKIVANYMDKPEIVHAPGRAVYHKFFDRVTIPEMKDYKVREEYYSTLFHELIHSTGHQDRLNREGITEAAAFGDSVYSFEELVAEMGAAMLCGVSRIETATIENSASYIQGWMRKLEENPKWVIQAAGKAQKAVDFMLGTTFEDETSGA